MSTVTAVTIRELAAAFQKLGDHDMKILALVRTIATQNIGSVVVNARTGTAISFEATIVAPAMEAANAILRAAMKQRAVLVEDVERLGGVPPEMPEFPHHSIDLKPWSGPSTAIALVGSFEGGGFKAYGPFDDWSKANGWAIEACNADLDADVGIALRIEAPANLVSKA